MNEEKQTLKWRDLVLLHPHEILIDLLLWTPWFFMAWWAVVNGLWVLAAIGWFFFFLTGLRLSHEAFHRNLGLPAVICDLLLLFLSPLMFTCLHATRYTHLQHHRFCLIEGDIEGLAAKYSPFEVLYKGFQYPFLSHRFAWNSNDEFTKYWMRLELIWIILFYSIGFYFFPFIFGVHFFAMIVAEGFVSFFAVWMVHHDCEDNKNPSRSIRGNWKRYLTYNMFYHFEHHAYPRVPTRNLPILAKRIDVFENQNIPRAF